MKKRLALKTNFTSAQKNPEGLRIVQHSLRVLWADQRGMVLVLALMLMGLLSALAAAYATMIRVDTMMRGAAGRERRGFYAAEAGLNVVMAQTRSQFDNYQTPGAGTGTITVGSGAQQRTVDYSVTPDPTCFPCANQKIAAGQSFAGLNSTPYRYQVSSTAENVAGDEEATLGAQFQVHKVPIFQFLAFSKDSLFIAPGATMNLHGRVHTNGNLYLNSINATLSVGDLQPSMPYVQVSAAKSIYRGANKPAEGGQQCTGTVNIDMLQDTVAPTPDLDPRTLACVGNGSSPVPTATLNAYLGSLLAGVYPIQLPKIGSLARGGGGTTGGIFWQSADLRIVLRLDLPRIALQFANFCPATATTPVAQNIPVGSELFPIEVQNADGTRNVNKTNSLWTFMCQRRGAIFYNDVPNGALAGTPNDGLANGRNNYTPPFQLPPSGDANARVYRRAGEDTNGDGIVDNNGVGGTTNSDKNLDICPVGLAGAPPWWRPDFCNDLGAWPNILATLPQSSWYQDTDYRRGGFYNRREGQWVYMLNVNIRALIDWNEFNDGPLFTPSDSSDNGLVFFLSVQGPNSNGAANNYGVRIFDSADLNTRGGTFAWPAPTDPTGLTVVSDQAVYIEGNYNTKDKYPAAVIGDAINVLSQSWEVRSPTAGGQLNDRKSMNGMPVRVVRPTDDDGDLNAICGGGLACSSFLTPTALGINAALVSGFGYAVEGPDVYNGGLENFMRFHEDWKANGTQLNYNGSLVSLDKSQHQINDWSCASVTCNSTIYTAPARAWDYDTAFDDVRWLPPLTPMVTYVQQAWYTRFYK